ncbi:thioredoxin fold domain-containing protein [Fulvimarina sp. MAC3]|uniref:thioredoxin fold domain-containing protein n=1 Tax=Fulvimarina sp. MAC3 TaxID=3148887 RepID=UPI0031FDCCFA
MNFSAALSGFAGVAALCAASWVSPSPAAELLMFERDGCPYCARFDAEIAPDYPHSEAGRIAPLKRVDITDDRRGGYEDIAPAVFTPTFVLMNDAGKEVGRLKGYPGKKYFYSEIEPMLEKLRQDHPLRNSQ